MFDALLKLSPSPATPSTFGLGLLQSFENPQYQWLFVERRFGHFLHTLKPSTAQTEDYTTKIINLMSNLNRHYWPGIMPWDITGLLTGSWATGTNISPGSDIDLIYLLPWPMFDQFNSRDGNIQSQILQDVRNALLPSYPKTEIKGDGQVVVVDFDAVKVELAPAFRCVNTPYVDLPKFQSLICDTNQGGRYKLVAPVDERNQLIKVNVYSRGDLSSLARMLKAWKKFCNVPIKSVALVQIAARFLIQWPHSGKGAFWYDWMIRDFFQYMLSQQNGSTLFPVSNEVLSFGNDWASRAQSALIAATWACEYEKFNNNSAAGTEWQKIFGNRIRKEA